MENCSTKPKKISLLNEPCYQIYLTSAPDGIGHNHQAIISDGNQQHSVFASFYPLATHPKSLANEISAYLLATALKLPVAPRAFILPVRAHYLQTIHPQLTFIDPNELCPLWCVSAIPGTNPKIYYNLAQLKNNPVFQADIAAWDYALECVVFDDWLGNSDRNAGNLIRTGKHRYTLIDHEDIAVHRTWHAEWLDPERDDIANKLAYILWGGYAVNDPKSVNRMMHFADKIMAANIHVLQELVYWWKLLLSEEELASLHRFIMKRATVCQHRIAHRFGALI